VGGRDVLDTGEISMTTYTVGSLPVGPTLYARIYTLIAGAWVYSDATFTATAPPQAMFSYPVDGEADVIESTPFAWSAAPGASGYYLTVGTTAGGRDILDSGGPLAATTYQVFGLPPGQKLYATVYALIGAAWVPTSISFMTATMGAQFSNPASGATSVYTNAPFSWSSMPGAQGYYLTIGTTPGARDVLDTGQIQGTSYPVPSLPPSTTLYATIYTDICGVWYPSSISFTTGAPLTPAQYPPTFTFPANGATGTDASQAFTWSAVPVAQRYYLTVGTSPGGRNVIDTGAFSAASTSYFGGLLPQKPLYATIYAEVQGGWYGSSVSFTPGPPPSIATFVNLTDGATGVDLYQGFDWTSVASAASYYLTVGSKPGGRDVYDSSTIHPSGTNHRFVPLLQPSTTYHATIYTQLNGNWFPSSLSFTTGADTGVEFSANEQLAFSLVDNVRSMADPTGLPIPGTALANIVAQYGGTYASCEEYTVTLLQELATYKIRNARPLRIAFIDDGVDSHELVQIYSSTQGQWVLIDPTFDLVPYRASDGLLATAADMNQATVAQSWSSITYTFLNPTAGDAYATGYYLDYPLLYLNLLGVTPAQPAITPYLAPVGTSTTTFGSYLVSTSGSGAVVELDGSFLGLGPTKAGPFSRIIGGSNIGAVCSSSTLYAPQRYVF
jgi:hypothetical protein